ncbi:MAG TPA: hypothetical protein VE978_19595 [Chitinophagales bacterium]|nr:hypothetical protein [Chitinophagales bacterium]
MSVDLSMLRIIRAAAGKAGMYRMHTIVWYKIERKKIFDVEGL